MTLRRQLLGALVATSLLTAFLLTVLVVRTLAHIERRAGIDRLEREARVLAAVLGRSSTSEVAGILERVQQELRVRAEALDFRSGEAAPTEATQSELVDARRFGAGVAVRTELELEGERVFVAVGVPEESGRFVRFSRPASQFARTSPEVVVALVVGTLVAFGVLAAIVFVLVGRSYRVIDELVAAAEDLAAGRAATDAPTPQPSELARLGRAIAAAQTQRLEDAARIARQSASVQVLTEGLQEGVLLIAADERVALANRAFLRILRLPFYPVGRRVQRVLRQPEALAAVTACLASAEEQRLSLAPGGPDARAYELHVTPIALESGRGALATFFDVTRLHALETMRQRFVADVSHELKTPITSITGAVETLNELPISEEPLARRFLDVAERQARRMHELVTDLLDLSRIETGAIRLQPEDRDLHRAVEEAIELVRDRHLGSEVRLVNAMPMGSVVLADHRRLAQVLVNLIDNALKFSPPGGEVRVAQEQRERTVEIHVEDDGPGIPSHLAPKVFTRFFRVDEGRAREAGGTGLGLAIVKHLVQLHHGSVRVEGAPGGGARFVVALPSEASASPATRPPAS